MKVVAVQGLRGGAGVSSLVAALAEALVEAGQSVLCIDLDPANLLRLHFNHPWHDERGWALAWREGRDWRTQAFALGERLTFVPYGRLATHDAEALDVHCHAEPDDWRRRLAELEGSDHEWVLFDVPSGPRGHQRQARHAATLRLTVAQSDPGCHARLAERPVGVDEYLLINAFSSRSALQNDIHASWKEQCHDWLVPLVIHRDEAMFEALAHKCSVIGHQPASLAAQDVRRLATWLMAYEVGA